MTDWSNPSSMVSRYFSVKEALWLPKWDRLANEADGLNEDLKLLLIKSFLIFDDVRELLGCPMNVHSGYRPGSYSVLVGGSMNDVHSRGQAVDFDCAPEYSIEDARTILLPNLAKLGIRLERGTTTWLHADTRAPGPSGRFFIP